MPRSFSVSAETTSRDFRYFSLLRKPEGSMSIMDGEIVAVAFRISKNPQDAAQEEAELRGMSFSAFARNCMIQELAKEEKGA